MEKYFYTGNELISYLVSYLGFTDEEAALNATARLDMFDEETHEHHSRCSGFLHNKNTDLYYSLSFTFHYGGFSDFYLDITPLKKYKETKLIEVVTKTGYRKAQ